MLAFSSEEQAAKEEGVLLHRSVRDNEHFLIDKCIDHGAEVDHFSPSGPKSHRTPLRAACAQANFKVVHMLLQRGASIFAHYARDHWTALHSAAEAGHDHIVRLLVSEVDELHENTELDGFPIVALLAECLNPKLLNNGSDLLLWSLRQMPDVNVNARSRRVGLADWSPMHILCARGRLKSVSHLIHAGAELEARSGECYVQSGTFEEFVQGEGLQVADVATSFESADCERIDDGLLPIHLAAFGGHFRIVHLLGKYAQSVNAVTKTHRWTSLMFAVWGGHVQCVSEVLHMGGRKDVNRPDCRADACQWTPLSAAVARWTPALVNRLVAYGADPLQRLDASDFPGQGFVKQSHSSSSDATDSCWSGADRRVSLLHTAVARGSLEMVQTVLSLTRAAHFSPERFKSSLPAFLAADCPTLKSLLEQTEPGSTRDLHGAHVDGHHLWVPPSPMGALAFHHPTSTGSSRARAKQASDRDATASVAHALARSEKVQDRARAHHLDAPTSEGPDRDPVTFQTLEGWSPAGLALVLHAADPARAARPPLLEDLPDATRAQNTRADVFLELLGTGRSLLEDRPGDRPPSAPQRLRDFSETLAIRVVDEFVRLCERGGASSSRVMSKVLHLTLCEACQFNHYKLAKHLLETGLVDPCCRFLTPIECRPLHIAARCGFGYLAQLLLNHKADPIESDENSELPVSKLTAFFHRQISELQARVAELQGE